MKIWKDSYYKGSKTFDPRKGSQNPEDIDQG